MAQQLQDIINSLNSVYDPQKQLINQQMQAIPGQFQAQQAGLDQQKTNAFNGIDSNANARGVLYSGAPIAEQQRYLGTDYLPAVANLKNQQQNQTFGLQNQYNALGQAQNQQAQGVVNTQLDREQQDRQFQQQLASYSAMYGNRGGGSYGGGGGAYNPAAFAQPAQQGQAPQVQQGQHGNPLSGIINGLGQGFNAGVHGVSQAFNQPQQQHHGFLDNIYNGAYNWFHHK